MNRDHNNLCPQHFSERQKLFFYINIKYLPVYLDLLQHTVYHLSVRAFYFRVFVFMDIYAAFIFMDCRTRLCKNMDIFPPIYLLKIIFLLNIVKINHFRKWICLHYCIQLLQPTFEVTNECENKGVDQLHSNHAADLSLCFHICKKTGFSWRSSVGR